MTIDSIRSFASFRAVCASGRIDFTEVTQPMPFAEILSGPGAILLGLAMLAVAFVLRRSGAKRARQAAKQNVVKEVRDAAEAAGQTGHSQLQQLELRLHEYGREIDALAQTRIAVLTQLIREADDTARELRTLLGKIDAAGAKQIDEESKNVAA